MKETFRAQNMDKYRSKVGHLYNRYFSLWIDFFNDPAISFHKTQSINWIRTWSVGVEDNWADHHDRARINGSIQNQT